MYEEITELEQDLVRILDRYKEVPLAIRVGVLFNVILVLQLHTGPIRDMVIPKETLPVTLKQADDDGPGMTMVERNLESG